MHGRQDHAKEKPAPGTLAATVSELKEGRWPANAQRRASRRQSPWNLLLLLALPPWLALWSGSVELAILTDVHLLRGLSVPQTWLWANAVSPFLLNIPLLFASIVPAMVITNYVVYYFVPPARRAMDAEDRAYPGTEYATAQPQLIRIALHSYPYAFVITVIGAVCR